MHFQTDQELNDYLTATFDTEGSEIIIMDGYPQAVIAIVDDPHTGTVRLVYSVEGILECLINQGMSYLEAVEYYDYNIERGLCYLNKAGPLLQYQGLPQTPVKAKETPSKTPCKTKTKSSKSKGRS